MQQAEVEDLKRLPLRAIVACAVRWAERVRPEFTTPDDPGSEGERAVDTAIAAAKAFAEGGETVTTPKQAMDIATQAANAAASAENSRSRYAGRTAALAAETLAHALTAFLPAAPSQADDIIDQPGDPLSEAIDRAASAAHRTEYTARSVLKETGGIETIADDYKTLLKQFADQAGQIGPPVDFKTLGPL